MKFDEYVIATFNHVHKKDTPILLFGMVKSQQLFVYSERTGPNVQKDTNGRKIIPGYFLINFRVCLGMDIIRTAIP